ncbi:MAG: hypothetical protein IT342_22900 [Candidatus Melainabacteria bacterium]|nr:hypothetical protein [Candidatus Melainabacteria bacterium]
MRAARSISKNSSARSDETQFSFIDRNDNNFASPPWEAKSFIGEMIQSFDTPKTLDSNGPNNSISGKAAKLKAQEHRRILGLTSPKQSAPIVAVLTAKAIICRASEQAS